MNNSLLTLLAYIDPGTGAMVLQVLLATILGAGMLFRRVLTAPLGWFRQSDASAGADAESDGDQDFRQAA